MVPPPGSRVGAPWRRRKQYPMGGGAPPLG
jgi:hypothetical protein